ncbi:MAG: hypothetical protein GY701_21735, partial [Sulfitobacter sp.]|nr:hypothetical protein [Sulfitobacter sp.]
NPETAVAAQTQPAAVFVGAEQPASPVVVGPNSVYSYDRVLGCCVAPNSRLGGLVDVAVDDPAAAALAQRLGGRPSVRFAGDASAREFDVVSDLYVAQSKPANFQLGSSFRNQAKATFETALETNRTPYFHFEGPPQAGVIAKLEEYGARYGIDPIIDVSPLG